MRKRLSKGKNNIKIEFMRILGLSEDRVRLRNKINNQIIEKWL